MEMMGREKNPASAEKPQSNFKVLHKHWTLAKSRLCAVGIMILVLETKILDISVALPFLLAIPRWPREAHEVENI